MTLRCDRRAVLRGSVLAAGAMVTPGASHAQSASKRLRVTWWGSDERNRRTMEVMRLYEQRFPETALAGEPANEQYFVKLATQMVGRGAADILQFEPNSFADFARRRSFVPLDRYLGSTIRTEAIEPSVLQLNKLDGVTLGVPHALNSFALMYDREVFEKARLPPPDMTTDWTAYADLMVELTKAVNQPGWWGSCDASGYSYAFNVWVRQQGADLFTADGKLAFTADHVAAWFTYWEGMRKRGGCVPAEVAALSPDSTISLMPLIQGKAGTSLAYSNQIVGMQSSVKAPLGLTMFPQGGRGAQPGQFYRPATSWCVYAPTRHADEAARFIDFFVNDPEAGRVLGVERGVPVNRAVRQAIAPGLKAEEKATIEYIEAIADKVTTYPPHPPVGGQQFGSQIKRAADQAAFGRASIRDSARALIDEMERLL